MSQAIFDDIVPTSTSGNELATLLNDFKDAIASGFSGPTRPANLQAGGFWVDDSADPILVFTFFDGSNDIPVFSIDSDEASSSVLDATDSFTVTKISDDDVGALLTLWKKRVSDGGAVLEEDYLGRIEFKSVADDASTPVTAKIHAQASEDHTDVAQGTDLILEATVAGSATRTEAARIKDGQLGLGTIAPTEKLHVVGNGSKIERRVNDTTAVKSKLRKSKLSGSLQTTNGETFATREFNSTDNAGAEILAAQIDAISTEAHSTTNHGTKLAIKTKTTGGTSATNKMVIGDKIEALVDAEFSALLSAFQHANNTPTGPNQSVTLTKSFTKFTNASLVSINNIAAPTDGKLAIIVNGTGSTLTLVHNSGGTAANRILSPDGSDVVIEDTGSVWIAYDTDETRWIVVGGSGGAIRNVENTSLALGAGGQIAIHLNKFYQTWRVNSSGGAVVLDDTPFGTSPPKEGSIIKVFCDDDADTVQIDASDIDYGCVGFDSIVFGKYTIAEFYYNETLKRYIFNK